MRVKKEGYIETLYKDVKCLRCGSEIEIPEKDIPTIIRREIIYNMDPVEKLLTFYF